VRAVLTPRRRYDLLEKGDGKAAEPGKEKLGGLLEEDEDEDEDGDDWKLKVCSTCRKKRGDLPVAHFAAASGHLDCLTFINNTDMEEITSFDKAQRSPLFYSCANNQTLTAVLLIEVAPQLVQLCDTNGDTPLHAASSSGSAELIELLISRGGADVNATNLLGIAPAHLAKNRRCLEVLFDAGADIHLRDKQKRSPLFVSCAMDRRDCAEFICEIIEIEGGSFQEVDRRGDTPLHAAACNGSNACTSMLLDLAVEPGVRNKKGLRPIDLAAKRGHEKCEQVSHRPTPTERALGAACEGFCGRGVSPRKFPSETARFCRRRAAAHPNRAHLWGPRAKGFAGGGSPPNSPRAKQPASTADEQRRQLRPDPN
jgi:hypothetical protein